MKNNFITLPNAITLANLVCGCVAIVAAMGGDLQKAFGLVATAAVCDLADGLAARLLNQKSELGKQLDSLADMVSFGVAPSAMLFASSGVWVAFAIAVFSAMRLAMFNIDDSQAEYFRGLPTPASALGIASLVAVFALPTWAVWVLVAIVCVLLVCRLRMFSVKKWAWSWHKNWRLYTFFILAAVLVATLGIGGVAASVALYVAMSGIFALCGR